MIKKLLLIAAVAVLSAACETEDEPNSYDQVGYTGTMTVQSLAGETRYTFPERNFDVAQEADGTVDLWMYDTQFVPMMPRMTMIVPGLAVGGSAPRFTLGGDRIIPYYRDGEDMLPMDSSRLITDFRGTLDSQAGTLTVAFVCMNFQVTYTGTEIEK